MLGPGRPPPPGCPLIHRRPRGCRAANPETGDDSNRAQFECVAEHALQLGDAAAVQLCGAGTVC